MSFNVLKFSLMGLAFGAPALVAATAAAAPPPQCATGRNLNFYNTGVLLARNLSDTVALSQGLGKIDTADEDGDLSTTDLVIDNPDAFESYVTGMIAGFFSLPLVVSGPPTSTLNRALTCRVAGMRDTVLSEAAAWFFQTVIECTTEGFEIADLSAAFYCAVQEAAPSAVPVVLPPPVTHPFFTPGFICEAVFEPVCIAEFDNYANFIDPFCAPFTTGVYSTVYSDSRTVACDY